jgi:hypothetical protein
LGVMGPGTAPLLNGKTKPATAGLQVCRGSAGSGLALELVIRYLLKPGDAALVDDPGYYNPSYFLFVSVK